MLIHFKPDRPIRVEIDISDFTIAEILSQTEDRQTISNPQIYWHPVVFYSRKIIPAECNYEIYDIELLAIIKTFKY
jgi:hypothetical protein